MSINSGQSEEYFPLGGVGADEGVDVEEKGGQLRPASKRSGCKCCGTELNVDVPTLIAITAMSFTLTIASHEHLGHTLACVALGGEPTEMGAFYVQCKTASSLNERLVAIAGPVLSLVFGIVFMKVMDRAIAEDESSAHMKIFLWHFFTVNLMEATGYMMFSGIFGMGDLGTEDGGAAHGVQPLWLYRTFMGIVGLLAYLAVIFVSIKRFDLFIGGSQRERVRRAHWISLIAYLSGAFTAIGIGLLNPEGVMIVLTSTIPSSMGGTSGMMWMMQWLNREKVTGMNPFRLERNWYWIGSSILTVLLYASVFGPTIPRTSIL